jgi:hypothetical protein
MLAKLRTELSSPSPAFIIACLALFVALGGSSYAAVTLKKNSVRSTHIRNGQVKRADLGASAVNSAKVGNASLLAQDFAPGQLPQGERGERGEKGATGDRGETGAPGSALGYAYIEADGSFDPARSKNVRVSEKFATGQYCIDFTGFVPRNVVASPEMFAAGDFVRPRTTPGSNQCSSAQGFFNVFVHVFQADGTTLVDSDFFITAN